MNDIIPTPEAAASAAVRLRECWADAALSVKAATYSDLYGAVLPLLEAIAAGRVFEVRPERCAECDGVGGFEWIDDHDTGTDTCPRCKGSGCEPAPPPLTADGSYERL